MDHKLQASLTLFSMLAASFSSEEENDAVLHERIIQWWRCSTGAVLYSFRRLKARLAALRRARDANEKGPPFIISACFVLHNCCEVWSCKWTKLQLSSVWRGLPAAQQSCWSDYRQQRKWGETSEARVGRISNWPICNRVCVRNLTAV